MRRRSLFAGLLSATLLVPLGLGPAHAEPTEGSPDGPDQPSGTGLPVVSALGLDRPGGTERPHHRFGPGTAGKISPSLGEASGPVHAFVELDAPAGVDVAEAGGDARAVRAQAARVERLAQRVVPSVRTSAEGAPRTVSVTSNLVAGMVVTGDAGLIRTLAAQEDVAAVHLIVPKTRSNTGTDILTGALDTWQATGRTGEGVRIGIIDTGIDYTHATFGGPGTAGAYEEAYGEDGTGPVPDGLLDDTKYLGGYDFAGFEYDASGWWGDPVPQPDENPIDAAHNAGGGHGTHVAGTAAGYGVTEDGSTFTGDHSELEDITDFRVGPGSAPQAGLYALKVFGDIGGSTALVVEALEWAADPNGDGDFSDRLDIVNLSLGSDASPADDPENLFIDQLAALGVLSVVASGNAGDVTSVGGSPGNARSSLTVANSVGAYATYDAVEVVSAPDTALEGLHPAQNSVLYEGTEDVEAEVVYLGEDVDGCWGLEEYADQIAGKIVWLWWDDDDMNRWCGSYDRWWAAEEAGAVGVLIGTTLPVFPASIAGNENIPGAQLTAAATEALLPQIVEGGVVVRLGPSYGGLTFVEQPEVADTLNPSSSRGVHGSLGIIKPDVAAPGTMISSAASGAGAGAVSYTGTSMSTPHVAGIAALVKEANPGWGATEVKAAVMNTAWHDLYVGENRTGPVYGPERVGSGRVDALDAAEAEVIAYATEDAELVSVAFGVVPVADETVTLQRTVTVRNTGATDRTYAVSYEGATTAGDAAITVAPSSITVAAGQTSIVTVTLTVDPDGLVRELDPTSLAEYDLGIPIPREYVAAVSGRLQLTPATGNPLRVPLHAAPRPVSDLAVDDVVFVGGGETDVLTVTGRPVTEGGWQSLMAPLQLQAESPEVVLAPELVTSGSSIAAGDIRYVGTASTHPQIAERGYQRRLGNGTLGVGIATSGEWGSLGTAVIPVINIDIDGDGYWDLETIIWKWSPDMDFTTVETYALEYNEEEDYYDVVDFLEALPVNGLWADTDTTVFDNQVVVAPLTLDAVGIQPGDTPTVAVSTYSWYAEDPSGIIDEVEPFTVDPFAPDVWFEAPGDIDNLFYLGLPGSDVTVHRSSDAPEGDLLVLHTHNATGERAQIVPWSTLDPVATSVALTAEGTVADAPLPLVATVTPADARGTVRFTRGSQVLGSAEVVDGVARLDVTLPAGTHGLRAHFEPASSRWLASSSPVTQVTLVQVGPEFVDVRPGHPFYTEIRWMSDSGLSTGTLTQQGRFFYPSNGLSRQAMAAFMYRYAESDWTPPANRQTFSDVPPGHPFWTEIEWMAEVGLSEGYADGTYGASRRISRQAMSAFLYRYADTDWVPAAGARSFSDVPAGHPFRTEIEWMAEVGLSEGYPDGTFGASRRISRQAMAAFLYRFDRLG